MLEINKIYCGDCLEVMKDIPDKSVDMVLCDLPYGITTCEWDVRIPLEPLWEAYKRIIKDNGAIVLTASQPFATDCINSNRDMFRYELIWEKTTVTGFFNSNKMPLRNHENILLFYNHLPTYNPQCYKTNKLTKDKTMQKKNLDKKSIYNQTPDYINNKFWKENGLRLPKSVIKFSNWNGALFGNTDNVSVHSTQKPVALFQYLIKTYTNENDLVLDNCIGSGTTAIAALKCNRNFIGIEKELRYVKIANDRIELFQSQYKLEI